MSTTARFIPLLLALTIGAAAQFGTPPLPPTESSTTTSQESMTAPAASPLQESPFASSVAKGKVSPEPVKLTILTVNSDKDPASKPQTPPKPSDGPKEVEDAAEQETEYPADETNEG